MNGIQIVRFVSFNFLQTCINVKTLLLLKKLTSWGCKPHFNNLESLGEGSVNCAVFSIWCSLSKEELAFSYLIMKCTHCSLLPGEGEATWVFK